MSLRHSSQAEPRCIPYKGVQPSAQVDRVQEITGSDSMNRERIKEVGRDGIVAWKEGIPEVSATVRQLEFGEIDFWQQLANVDSSTTKIELTDFKTSKVDLAVFCSDDDETFKSTVWLEELKVSGFSLNIGDPEALIERSVNLVGEKHKELQGNNKYLIEIRKVVESGEAGDIDLVIGAGDYANYPDPVENPNTSDEYILKVVRYSSATGETEEITEGVAAGDFGYDSATKTITLYGAADDDVYRIYYSATTYITGSTPWTDNDTDAAGLEADCVTVYLRTTGDQVYRLQSCNVDVSLDRFDVREIGNPNTVKEGANDITVSISLDRILETIRMEELAMGKTADWGIIDIDEFLDDSILTIKIYEDNTKTTFKMGYEFKDLAVTSLDVGVPVDEYNTRSVTLEGEEGIITNNESDLEITA